MIPLLAISSLNHTMGNLTHTFGNFTNTFFGTDSNGVSLMLGIVILVLYVGIVLFLRISLDAAVVVLFPLVLLLCAMGALPWSVGVLALIAGGAIVYLAVSQWLRR